MARACAELPRTDSTARRRRGRGPRPRRSTGENSWGLRGTTPRTPPPPPPPSVSTLLRRFSSLVAAPTLPGVGASFPTRGPGRRALVGDVEGGELERRGGFLPGRRRSHAHRAIVRAHYAFRRRVERGVHRVSTASSGVVSARWRIAARRRGGRDDEARAAFTVRLRRFARSPGVRGGDVVHDDERRRDATNEIELGRDRARAAHPSTGAPPRTAPRRVASEVVRSSPTTLSPPRESSRNARRVRPSRATSTSSACAGDLSTSPRR